MDIDDTFLTTLLRLVLSLLLAGAVGWEREIHGKSAGVRTHMMVGLGACTFTVLTRQLYAGALEGRHAMGMDPLRIVESVATGVGFLGAGCIIQGRGGVHGLTTAAGIWVVGALGVACGTGQYRLAALTTLLSLVVLHVVQRLEERFSSQASGATERRTSPPAP